MRILFIPTSAGIIWGGSDELWSRTCSVALQEGHQCYILLSVTTNLHKSLQALIAKGAVIIDRRRQKSELLLKIKDRLYKTLNIPGILLRKLSKYNFDVICINQGATFSVVPDEELYHFIINTEKPVYLISQYNDEHKCLKYSQILRARSIFNKARKVLFVSERNRYTAERQIAAPISNSSIIENPVNLSNLSLVKWPPDFTVNMAVVARLEANYKGQDLLLEVLSRQKWLQRSWNLNLYGEGRDKQFLQELTSYYKLEDRVHFNGYVEDIRGLWEYNHILVLPSIGEGTPLALRESMICGRPAIVTNVGDNAKFVEEEVNGFIAEAPTLQLLDAALEKAWKRQEKWQEMGKIGHEKIMKSMDPTPPQSLLNILLN
jgi:L-malate glycosyltransferase